MKSCAAPACYPTPLLRCCSRVVVVVADVGRKAQLGITDRVPAQSSCHCLRYRLPIIIKKLVNFKETLGRCLVLTLSSTVRHFVHVEQMSSDNGEECLLSLSLTYLATLRVFAN